MPRISKEKLTKVNEKKQQAGTGPSRRHNQGSKTTKGLPRVNLQYSKIEKAKNGPSGALKGDTSEIVIILSQLKGEPLQEKQILEKNVSQCRKTEQGTLWGFSTSILSQNIKKLKR